MCAMDIHDPSIEAILVLILVVPALLSDNHISQQELHTELCTIISIISATLDYKSCCCYVSLQCVVELACSAFVTPQP